MVKVQFKCVDTNIHETERCIVIKYTGTFEGKHHCIIFSIKKYQVCLQLVNSCIGSSVYGTLSVYYMQGQIRECGTGTLLIRLCD